MSSRQNGSSRRWSALGWETTGSKRFYVRLSRVINKPTQILLSLTYRSCPGVHFANAMLWLASASLITAFDFGPVVGEDGKPEIPSGRFLGETIT